MRKLKYSLLRVRKGFKNLSKSLFQYLLLISILTSNVGYPAIAIAQEMTTPTPQESEESVDIPIVDTSEDILEEGISTSIFEEDTPVVPESTFENGIYTVNSVSLGEYIYPDNPLVKVNFTEINQEGNLVISKVTLTEEQKTDLNTTESYAWDITSSMTNGSFRYDLTLPNNLGNDVEVKYSEDGVSYDNTGDFTVSDGSLVVKDLDHFTTFVVINPNPVGNGVTSSTESCAVTGAGFTCYDNIQAAIDDADNGDIINVKDGIYNVSSSILVNKGVQIIGSANSKIVTTTQDTPAFIISADNVTLSNFEITTNLSPFSVLSASTGSEITGALVLVNGGATNVVITNNTIYADELSLGTMKYWTTRGITVDSGSASITNNVIHSVRNGIVIRPSNTVAVNNNTIFNTKGGIMQYTSDFTDAGNRVMSSNSWNSTIVGKMDHNEWDIVWNSATYGFPVYSQSLIATSNANNDAYVLDLRRDDTTSASSLINNRSHVFVTTGGVDKVHQSSGNINEPFLTLPFALTDVSNGGTIILQSDLDTTSEININKPVTLEGNNFTIFSKFAETSNSNNAAIGIYADNTIIKDLTVDGTDGTDLHGIKIYVANNVLLDHITAKNYRTGIVVNGSTVNANDITTSGNSWHGINVDQGGGVNSEAKLTIHNTSHHNEVLQIFVDDTRKDVSVIDVDNQYKFKDNGYSRVYNLPSKVTLLSPIDGFVTNQTSVLQTWESSSSNIAQYEYRSCSNDADVDGFCTIAYSTTTTLPSRTVNSNNVVFWWQVRAVDLAGVEGEWTEAWKITIDTTPPTVPVLESPINGISINDNTPLMQWSDSSDVLGIKEYKYRIYHHCTDQNNIPGSCSVWPNSSGLSRSNSQYQAGTTQDGIYYWQVKAVDNANNESSWSLLEQFIIDTVNPTAPEILFPLEGDAFKNIPILNDWTDSSDLNGISEYRVEYQYDNLHTFPNAPYRMSTVSERNHTPGTWEEGGVKYRVQAIDNAGNLSPWSDWRHYYYDITSPTLSFEGIRYINATTTDSLSMITNDNTPLIIFKAEDSLTGVDSAYVDSYPATFDGTYWLAEITSPLPEGAHTVILKAIDKAGNEKTLTQDIFIDTKAPTAAHTYLKDGVPTTDTTYVKGVNQLSFTAEYFDAAPSSGILKDSYVIFDSNEAGTARTSTAYCGWRNPANTLMISANPVITPVPFSNCKSALPDGEYFMYHQVYDNATRKDIPSITQFRDVKGLHFIIDNVAPAVPTGLTFSDQGSSEVKSCGGWSNSHKGAIIDWNDNTEGDFDHYEYISYNADGSTGPLRTFTDSNFDASWWTVPQEGLYGFKIRAVDKAGNMSDWTEVCGINVDWTEPEISGVSDMELNEGDTLPTSEIVTISDNYELDKFCYKATNSTLGTIIDECITPIGTSIDLAQLVLNEISPVTTADTSIAPEGDYFFSYNVFDKAGNSPTEQTFKVTINNVAPKVTLTASSTNIVAGGSTNFDLSFVDPSDTGTNTPDDSDWTYTFTMGDSSSMAGTSTHDGVIETNYSHTYTTAGTYYPQLEVCENSTAPGEGVCTTAQLTIVVTPVPAPTTEAAVQGATTGPTNNTRTTTPTFSGGIGGPEGENLTEDQLLAQTTEENTTDGEVKGAQTCENPKTISGYVYVDKNDNNQKDEKETTFEGISIRIYTEDQDGQTTIKELTTDSNGYWETEICPGQYNISIDKTNLPKNFDTEFGDVLSVNVPESADTIQADIPITDNRNFWQKNWPWIVLGLALISVTSLLLLDRRRDN